MQLKAATLRTRVEANPRPFLSLPEYVANPYFLAGTVQWIIPGGFAIVTLIVTPESAAK